MHVINEVIPCPSHVAIGAQRHRIPYVPVVVTRVADPKVARVIPCAGVERRVQSQFSAVFAEFLHLLYVRRIAQVDRNVIDAVGKIIIFWCRIIQCRRDLEVVSFFIRYALDHFHCRLQLAQSALIHRDVGDLEPALLLGMLDEIFQERFPHCLPGVAAR